MYSSGFGVTLVALTMITSLVILAVSFRLISRLSSISPLRAVLLLRVHLRGYKDRLFSLSRVHTIDIVSDGWEEFISTCENEEYTDCAVIIDGHPPPADKKRGEKYGRYKRKQTNKVDFFM